MPLHRLARRSGRAVLATCCCGLLLGALAPAVAQDSGAGSQGGTQALVEALARAHAAVVGVEVRATEDAGSTDTLGRVRSGSGVVIDDQGLVLTIGYLTLEADQIQLVTRDGRRLPARAVAYDLATGFGLVRPLLPLAQVPSVRLAPPGSGTPGEPLLVGVGGAGGGIAATRLVSRRAFSGYWEYHIETALFTSPPVGNHSGAALFNRQGELMGIGSLFVPEVAGAAGPLPGNMFVPVDLLHPILAELQQTGTTLRSRRPWLGLSSAEHAGRVLVVRVSPGSPAHAAGMVRGDVVLAIDGTPVDSLEGFYKKLWAHPRPDEEVVLTVLQGGQARELRIRAVDRRDTLRKPAGV